MPTPERPGCFLYILLERYARESFVLYTHNDVLHPIKVSSAASRTALPFFLFYFLMRFLNTRPRLLMFVTVSVCTSLLTLMLLTVFSFFRLPSPGAQNATAAFEARRETATWPFLLFFIFLRLLRIFPCSHVLLRPSCFFSSLYLICSNQARRAG